MNTELIRCKNCGKTFEHAIGVVPNCPRCWGTKAFAQIRRFDDLIEEYRMFDWEALHVFYDDMRSDVINGNFVDPEELRAVRHLLDLHAEVRRLIQVFNRKIKRSPQPKNFPELFEQILSLSKFLGLKIYLNFFPPESYFDV